MEEEEAEGEAFIDDCEPKDYAASIDLSGKKPVIRLNAFETTVGLMKI